MHQTPLRSEAEESRLEEGGGLPIVRLARSPEEETPVKKLFLLAVVGAAVFSIVAVAQAAIVQTFQAKFTGKAGKPTAYQVSENTSLTADDPGYQVKGQPPPQSTQILRVQKGVKFGGKYFARCKLANLQANGPAGCPSKSKIGTGVGTGSAKPILDQVSAKLTLFNGEKKGGKDTVYVFTLPDVGPTFVVVGTISKISKGQLGWELRFKIDPIKTLPNAPDAAIISVKTQTPTKTIKKNGKKRYLIVAPKTCKGKWAYQGEFLFTNGQKAVVDGTQSCKK
jgi:hypothetical protein